MEGNVQMNSTLKIHVMTICLMFQEMAAVYLCLSAVLFLSNIEFLESSVGGAGETDSYTDGVIIDDEYPLHTGA